MNEELSGGKNGIVYERQELQQVRPGTDQGKQTIPKAKPMTFSKADIAFAVCMLICGYLYWNLMNTASMGLGVTLFAAVLCLSVLVYYTTSGIRQSKQSAAILGLILLSALNFVLFDGQQIKLLNFIFLSLCFVYWVCISAGMRLENKISVYIVSDMMYQLFVVPFGNFTGCFMGIRQIFAKNKKGKGFLSGAVGILVILPVLILVISLLKSADAAFENLTEQIRFSFMDNMLATLPEFILGLPVACYLFGLIYGDRYKRNTGNPTLESVNGLAGNLRFVPGTTVFSALTALNMLYAVFFLSQTAYLFSAFRDSLPQSMTYAEYARRGFFELCAISGINLAVIIVAQLITKRDKIKILKGETIMLCVFTIALIITAMSKMGMYIGYYGLTQLRVYTSWFMIVLLFLFVIVLIRQFKDFNGTRIAAVGCICLFMVLCYGNADGLIAQYNIERYQAGTMESLDVASFAGLSDGAVPYLYELYQTNPDPAVKSDLRNVIKGSDDDHVNIEYGFREFNLQKYRADQIRSKI